MNRVKARPLDDGMSKFFLYVRRRSSSNHAPSSECEKHIKYGVQYVYIEKASVFQYHSVFVSGSVSCSQLISPVEL